MSERKVKVNVAGVTTNEKGRPDLRSIVAGKSLNVGKTRVDKRRDNKNKVR